MNKDKSAEKRYQLSQEILQLEKQEEDFSTLQQRFEGSLDDFYQDFQKLSKQEEELLQEAALENKNLMLDLEENQQLHLKVKQYVDESLAELSDVHTQFKHASEEKREKLIEERNSLPWE